MDQTIDQLCDLYLGILDRRQNNVYNIRMMHHEVWKRTRPQKVIKHHRAGSRVERQLRLLPTGAKSDVDYKYEVDGIIVDISRKNPESLYYKASTLTIPGSEAYGVVYATRTMMERLLSDNTYKKIFESCFEFDITENAFMLIPNRFKENVVNECGMDMRKDSLKRRIQSPAISGRGAMNDYDAVPCLRLSRWPLVAEKWKHRKTINRQVFSTEWRSRIFREESLFIVPTGNPLSEMEPIEWRLSYSFIEKECFEQIHSVACHRMRQLYGILKCVFKNSNEKEDLLNSYHLKTLFLWKVEKWPVEKWNTISVTDFVTEFYKEIKYCLQTRHLDHFFIEGCNIFPYYKLTSNNQFPLDTANTCEDIKEILIQTILTDLCVPRNGNYMHQAFSKLKSMDSNQFFGSYVSAYLTRLLSVCIHSVYDNLQAQNLQNCLIELYSTFEKYRHDTYIQRIVPILNRFLVRFCRDVAMPSSGSSLSSLDLTSIRAMEAFEEYVLSKRVSIDKVDFYLEKCYAEQDSEEMIGVTVMKMEAEKMENDPIQYIFKYLSEKGNQSKRIFIDPLVILLHLKIKHFIQIAFRYSELQNQKVIDQKEEQNYGNQPKDRNQHHLQKRDEEHKTQYQGREKKHEVNQSNQIKQEETKQLHQRVIKAEDTKQTNSSGIKENEHCYLHENTQEEEVLTLHQKNTVEIKESQMLKTKNNSKKDIEDRETINLQSTQSYQSNKEELFSLLQQMTTHVVNSSERLPYVGILSYKYTGLLLLRGYQYYLREMFDFDFPDILHVTPESLEELPKFSTNLDIT